MAFDCDTADLGWLQKLNIGHDSSFNQLQNQLNVKLISQFWKTKFQISILNIDNDLENLNNDNYLAELSDGRLTTCVDAVACKMLLNDRTPAASRSVRSVGYWHCEDVYDRSVSSYRWGNVRTPCWLGVGCWFHSITAMSIWRVNRFRAKLNRLRCSPVSTFFIAMAAANRCAAW